MTRRPGSTSSTVPHRASPPEALRSQMRPPAKASKRQESASAPKTDCASSGHQSARPAVKWAQASKGPQETATDLRRGGSGMDPATRERRSGWRTG
ncbi:MAG: hypothetical protein IT380_30075 [Myxococcales bacterium]|nr:hypothetical protein [Myxococcales bacterium]